MAYANISGLMLFENARKATSKVTVIDVSVFIGPTEEDFLLGAVSYFNDGDTPVKFEDSIHYCQIRTGKMEEGFQVHSGNPERYLFVGDLKTSIPRWVSETLEGTTVKSRFRLEVDEVTFVTNPPPSLPALTSAITTPSSASESGKGMGRFSKYKCARTDSGVDTPPTSSPSPAI
ncbi:hypothetical protein B0H13DRAFT_2324997 [Mycena leptocephala]|nr:hypothetical protein B0H13DRAFT_2324997 [Mycena leptocephala]